MSRLKRGWPRIFIIAAITSLIVSYVVLAYLYKFIAPEEIELMGALKQPLKVYEGIMGDENLKVIVPFLPFALMAGFLYLVRDTIFDLKYDDASKFGIKGSAKWGDPFSLMNNKTLYKNTKYGNLKKSLALPEGIILGEAENSKNLLIMHDKTDLDTRNVFVNGPSGSGKGQSYVLPNIVNNRNESMIVVDTKGENYALTAQLKRDQGYKVYMVDFRNFEHERYNPLDYVKNDEDAQKVSEIISKNSVEDGKQDFFSERAQKLLAGLISYVKSEYPQDQANMAKVIEVYTEYVSDSVKCSEWLENMPDGQPAKKMLISVLADLTSENTRGSVTASFQSAISIFQLNRVQKMTMTSDFSFDDFPEEKSIVYVKISTPDNAFKPLTSVFFSQMIERFFEIGDNDPLSRLKTPVHFMLDEFANIGKIDNYKNTLALCRGYRMYMHTIVQNVSQLESKALYGKEDTKSIIASHSAKLILKVGEKDSAKYWSEWFGQTTVSYKSTSSSHSKQGKTTNTSTQFEKKDLLSYSDLMEMPNDRAYLILTGQPPLKINKSWQSNVYPELLSDKNREPNYLNIRQSLGYTDKPVNDLIRTEDEESVNLFSSYQNKKNGTVEKLLENIEPEEMNEEIEVSKAEDLVSEIADKMIETELYENLAMKFQESLAENNAPTESGSVIEYGPPLSITEHDELDKAFNDEEEENIEDELTFDMEEEMNAELQEAIDENPEEVEDDFAGLLAFDVPEDPEEQPKEKAQKNDEKIDTEDTNDLLKSLDM